MGITLASLTDRSTYFEVVDSGPPSTSGPAPASLSSTSAAVARLTVSFAGALALILVVTQGRNPRILVVASLVVYGIVATLWTRAQYAESLDGTLTVLRKGFVYGLLALGALGLAGGAGLVLLRGSEPDADLSGFASVAHSRIAGTAIVIGVLLLYLGAGFLIVRHRAHIGADPSAGSPRALAVRTAVMVVSVATGLALLGHAPNLVSGLLVLAGLLGFPYTVSLASEHAIRAFARPTATRSRVWFSCAGAGLLIGGTVVVGILGNTWLPVVVMIALALLILAIVSATLADIAVVLAAVVLLGLTPVQDRKLDEALTRPGEAIVALGDSYMSGEGASTYIAGTDEGGANECRRASTAWPVLASQTPPFHGLVFLACSGAVSFNVRERTQGLLPEVRPQTDEGGTQLQQYRDRYAAEVPSPALVVMSLGGNDAGFASIGLTCLAPHECDDILPTTLGSPQSLALVRNRLRQAYADVRATFEQTPVAVIPYPDPIALTEEAGDAPRARRCPQADLGDGDITFIRAFLADLNRVVAEVAAEFGFYYVAPMVTALKDQHLQLCDPENNGRPGLNFIGVRSVNGLAQQRFKPTNWHHNSLHPNERGHAAMNVAFRRWLADEEARTSPADPTRAVNLQTPQERLAAVAASPVSETDLVADLVPDPGRAYDQDDPLGFEEESTDWTLQQVGSFGLARGAFVLAVVLGAWLIGVTFFGWRRRVHADSP